MVTLGIDLSASPKKTAACLITWSDTRSRIGPPDVGLPILDLDDGNLIDLMGRADWAGIDAPFGWPAEFVQTVAQWADGGVWSEIDRSRLRFRETDRYAHDMGRLPLSVSSDRIAVTAMRCASLLSGLAQRRFGLGGSIDRSGRDGVVEVYPGAALTLWADHVTEVAFDPTGYKGGSTEALVKRETVLEALETVAPWLRFAENPPLRESCLASDDALDSVLCALVARAAALGKTLPPHTVEQTAAVGAEGWIHLPEPGSLAELIGA